MKYITACSFNILFIINTHTHTHTHTAPATGAFSTEETTQYDHTWTIVGAVSSFVGGVVIGILLMAVFYNRKNFLWSKYFPDRRSYDDGEKGGKGAGGYDSWGGGGGDKG